MPSGDGIKIPNKLRITSTTHPLPNFLEKRILKIILCARNMQVLEPFFKT